MKMFHGDRSSWLTPTRNSRRFGVWLVLAVALWAIAGAPLPFLGL